MRAFVLLLSSISFLVAHASPYAINRQVKPRNHRRQLSRRAAIFSLPALPFAQSNGRIYRVKRSTRTIPVRDFTGREILKVSLNDCAIASIWSMFAAQMCFPRITTMLYKCNEGLLRGQYYRLVTACTLHGGPIHLLCNTLSLNNIGPQCEKYFGRKRFACVLAVAGVGGSLASWWLSPVPSLGASGAIFCLIGAWSVFLYENQGVLGKESANAGLRALAQTIGLNILIGATIPGIDQAGHLGGLLAGAAAGYLFGPRLDMHFQPFSGQVLLLDRPIISLPR